MWKLLLISILLSEITAEHVDSFKILVVSPLPSKSHSILGEGIVRHLLRAGHEVTSITAYPAKSSPPNLHQIDVSSNLKNFPANLLSIKKILDKEVDLTQNALHFEVIKNFTSSTCSHENVQKLLLNPEQEFDLVIAEWFFTETYAGFHSVFNCPLIWFSSMEPHWMILQLIDEKPNPSYNVDINSDKINPLNFLERAEELLTQLTAPLRKNIHFDSMENEMYIRYFGPAATVRGRELVPLEVAKYNASLVLGNSHVSLGEATRLPQNYKPIGGYHIDRVVKPLPEDLKKLMDESKDGVIYFSMGSNLKGSEWPEVLKKSILKTFGGLKQTVLWKFEEALTDLPKNVHILKWAPQPSILAHPNCVLFITHGGLLSTTETIHFGVPIIGIPAFADQFTNVKRAVIKGFARKVDLSYNIGDDLKEAIEEVLKNPKYKNKVKELSLIYHDRPVTPGRELEHWSEHVIRTGGAPHLRSPALMLSWYQKAYLDLLAVILAIVYPIYFALKILCSKKKTQAKVASKKKRN